METEGTMSPAHDSQNSVASDTPAAAGAAAATQDTLVSHDLPMDADLEVIANVHQKNFSKLVDYFNKQQLLSLSEQGGSTPKPIPLPKEDSLAGEHNDVKQKETKEGSMTGVSSIAHSECVEQIKAVLSTISMDASTDMENGAHIAESDEDLVRSELDDDMSGYEQSHSRHERFQELLQHWGIKLRKSLADIKSMELKVHKETKEMRRLQGEVAKCRERIETSEQKLKELKTKRNTRAMKLREAVDDLQSLK